MPANSTCRNRSRHQLESTTGHLLAVGTCICGECCMATGPSDQASSLVRLNPNASAWKPAVGGQRVHTCAECRIDLPKSAFSKSQLAKGAEMRCPPCLSTRTTYPCMACGMDLPRRAFSRSQLAGKASTRRCSTCLSVGALVDAPQPSSSQSNVRPMLSLDALCCVLFQVGSAQQTPKSAA